MVNMNWKRTILALGVFFTGFLYGVELPYASSITGPVPRERMQEVVQKLLDEGVAAGWQSCAQCCVYIDGEKVVDVWAGVMDKTSKKPIDGDTLLPIFSTEKPLLATAMHIAHDRGLVDYDDPVSKYWPEFAGDGKEKLTIRQLLGHRAGMPAGFDKESKADLINWEHMVKVAAAAKPVWTPGTKTGYLSQSYAWYVGVPLTRIFNRPINDLLTDEVLKPSGIERDFYFSVPDSELSRCATVYADKPGDAFLRMNDVDYRRACIPSAYAVSSARGLAKFYMRLAGMDGKKPLIRPETLAEASTPERWEGEPLPSAEELVTKWQMIFALGWGVWGDPGDLGRIIGQGGIGGSEGYGDVRNRIAIGYTCGTSIATPDHDLRPAIYRACGVRTRHMPRPLYTGTRLSDDKPLIADGDSIAFLGDSITEAGNYPNGYINLFLRALELNGVKVTKYPAGVAGDRSDQMLARLEKSVLVKKPTWMTYNAGINDYIHLHVGNAKELEAATSNYVASTKAIFDRCDAAGVKVIVLAPTLMAGEVVSAYYNVVLRERLIPWLAAEAKRRGYPYEDLNAREIAFLNGCKLPRNSRGYQLTGDGIHFNDWGNMMMAEGLCEVTGVKVTGEVRSDWHTRCRIDGRSDRGYATPESQGVDSEALLRWVDALEKKFEYVHGFVVRRHGFTIAEGSWKPFDTLTEQHMLYSHSKSFTATAVGFLVDDGKLDLDECIVDILPEKAPLKELQSENLRRVRVRDLLTMNAGTTDDVNLMTPEDDWVKAFFQGDFAVAPGTKFSYSTISTHVLGAVVEKRAGMDLMAFLKRRLFDKIGIQRAWSTHSPTGLAVGGSGMRMTTRDLSLFGQFYLQEGEWNGERLLSKEWVRLATSRQSWSRGGIRVLDLVEQGGDWEQGYGFQFWRCRNDAYRADGACGQLTLVMPKEDMVVSLQSGCGSFQGLLDTIWNILMPGVKSMAFGENQKASEALRTRCALLEIAPVAGAREGAEKFYNRKFVFDENSRGFKSVLLYECGDLWIVKFQARGPERAFAAKKGAWHSDRCVIDPEPDVESWGRINGEQTIRASAAVQPSGDFVFRGFLTETPDRLTFRFYETNGVQKVSAELWGVGGCVAEGSVK